MEIPIEWKIIIIIIIIIFIIIIIIVIIVIIIIIIFIIIIIIIIIIIVIKKCQHVSRVMEMEQDTFTPLVFTTTGGMAEECKRYHNRLAELLAINKGEDYASTVSWVRPG